MAFLKGIGKLKETVEAGIKAGESKLNNVDLKEAAKTATRFASQETEKAIQTFEKHKKANPEGQNSEVSKKFIELLWVLAHIDGKVTENEEEKLEEIACNIDANYPHYSNELKYSCRQHLDESTAEFGLKVAAKVEAQKIIEQMKLEPQDAALVCWNLLSIASADSLDDDEIDFIRFSGEKAGIDPVVFEELKNYIDCIVEIETTQEQLKSSGRSYSEINPLIEELEHRKQVTLSAAQALVTDE